jgi:hypothetical protein
MHTERLDFEFSFLLQKIRSQLTRQAQLLFEWQKLKSLLNLQVGWIFMFDIRAEKIKSLLPLIEDTRDVRSQGNVFSYRLTDTNTVYFGNRFVTSEANMTRRKVSCTFRSVTIFTHKCCFCCVYIYIYIYIYTQNNGAVSKVCWLKSHHSFVYALYI